MSDGTTDPTPQQPDEPVVGAPPPQPPPDEGDPPDDGGDDGDDGDGGDLVGREAKARREARNLRATLKAERANKEQAISDATSKATADLTDRVNDLEAQVAERDAMLAGVGKFKDPRDVARFIDVASTPADKLGAEIDKVLKERPYLAAGAEAPGPLPQGQQSESNGQTRGGSDWLRDAMTR
jgi:hypothetical protein